jgi:hypothetical protein
LGSQAGAGQAAAQPIAAQVGARSVAASHVPGGDGSKGKHPESKNHAESKIEQKRHLVEEKRKKKK